MSLPRISRGGVFDKKVGLADLENPTPQSLQQFLKSARYPVFFPGKNWTF